MYVYNWIMIDSESQSIFDMLNDAALHHEYVTGKQKLNFCVRWAKLTDGVDCWVKKKKTESIG